LLFENPTLLILKFKPIFFFEANFRKGTSVGLFLRKSTRTKFSKNLQETLCEFLFGDNENLKKRFFPLYLPFPSFEKNLFFVDSKESHYFRTQNSFEKTFLSRENFSNQSFLFQSFE